MPKRRISHHRRGGRRSHQALKGRQMVACPQCGNLTLPHSVCRSCGTYKGAQILKIEEEKKGE